MKIELPTELRRVPTYSLKHIFEVYTSDTDVLITFEEYDTFLLLVKHGYFIGRRPTRDGDLPPITFKGLWLFFLIKKGLI
jgi:hypothetical protein